MKTDPIVLLINCLHEDVKVTRMPSLVLDRAINAIRQSVVETTASRIRVTGKEFGLIYTNGTRILKLLRVRNGMSRQAITMLQCGRISVRPSPGATRNVDPTQQVSG
jgi:hypothetical protein